MKCRLFLHAAVCFLFSISGILYAESTIAVFNFENNSIFKRELYEPLSSGLSQIMISELSQVTSLQIVEREKLNKILDEIKLSQSGVTTAGKTAEVGSLVGAGYMVFGSFIVNTKEEIRIDIRVIQVETGLTVKAAEITGTGEKFLELIQKLSRIIVTALDVELSDKEKKKLDTHKKMKFSALMNYSNGIKCEDNGEWDKSAEYFKNALREEPGFHHVKERVLQNRHNYSNNK